MSAFLGPIHHWLFNKIEVSEKLFSEILVLADNKGVDAKALENASIEKFGNKVVGKLEDNIDTDNIHGWLQARIQSVESRLAFISTSLVNDNKITNDEFIKVFEDNAMSIAKDLSIDEINPEGLYNLIFNYLLSGMPCDRVNTVTESSDDALVWVEEIDIHKQYWDTVNGDVSLFHKGIEKWIETFVATSNCGFIYKKVDNDNKIERN